MSYRELGIEAYPSAQIFKEIHRATRANWLERNAGTIVGVLAIAAGALGFFFRCL